uniref:Uncharacterized protein n=1 Tax=Cajanus cajan TaxID=3821 RepID=A0A151RJN0_CAJCA|nr:hypothetical protein KK1_035827 [Cajanus cajan]
MAEAPGSAADLVQHVAAGAGSFAANLFGAMDGAVASTSFADIGAPSATPEITAHDQKLIKVKESQAAVPAAERAAAMTTKFGVAATAIPLSIATDPAATMVSHHDDNSLEGMPSLEDISNDPNQLCSDEAHSSSVEADAAAGAIVTVGVVAVIGNVKEAAKVRQAGVAGQFVDCNVEASIELDVASKVGSAKFGHRPRNTKFAVKTLHGADADLELDSPPLARGRQTYVEY